MRINSIEFVADNYSSDHEMWQDIISVMQVLIKNEYIISIKYEDCGIYSLQFDYESEDIAEYHLRWLSFEESEFLRDNYISSDELNEIEDEEYILTPDGEQYLEELEKKIQLK